MGEQKTFDTPIIELIEEFKTSIEDKSIDKKLHSTIDQINAELTKPSDYIFLKKRGFASEEMELYNSTYKETPAYSNLKNKFKQLNNFAKNNNFDIILNDNVSSFIRDKSYRAHANNINVFCIEGSNQTQLDINNKIIEDIKEFDDKYAKTYDIFYNMTSHRGVIGNFIVYSKKRITKMKREKGDVFNIYNKKYYVLYSQFQNTDKLLKNQSNKYYEYSLQGNKKNFMILYPIHKFGMDFWVIVSDSSKLIKAKTFPEYVKDKTEPEEPVFPPNKFMQM